MASHIARRTAPAAALGLLALTMTFTAEQPAHAAANRIRLGAATDVSRSSWNGPAFTMNGAGAVVPASMSRAIDEIRGGTGSIDVVVLAGSAPTSGSHLGIRIRASRGAASVPARVRRRTAAQMSSSGLTDLDR